MVDPVVLDLDREVGVTVKDDDAEPGPEADVVADAEVDREAEAEIEFRPDVS